jgi:hypothetical protein
MGGRLSIWIHFLRGIRLRFINISPLVYRKMVTVLLLLVKKLTLAFDLHGEGLVLCCFASY